MKRLALILLVVIPIALLLYIAPWAGDVPAIPSGNEAASIDREDLPTDKLTGTGDERSDEAPGKASDDDQAKRQALSDAHIRVSGQLVDGHDAPMGLVELNLYYGEGSGQGFFAVLAPASQKKKPDAATKTDASGRFTFKTPTDKGGRIRLVSNELVWSKQSPRFMPSEKDLDLGQLTVDPGAVLLGRVVSDNNLPIRDAKVILMAYEAQFVSRQAKTNDQGEFELRGLPGGQSYLTVSSKGYMTSNLQVLSEIGKTKNDFVIRLRVGHELSGFALDDQSQPVVGASVRVSGASISREDGSSEYGGSTAVTDKNGEFHAQGLGPGPFSLAATANGYATTNLSKLTESSLPVRVEMMRLGKIVGRLVDETGMPIPGSRVRATNRPPQEKPKPSTHEFALALGFDGPFVFSSSGSGKTDKDGKFTVPNIKPGQVWLIAEGTHRQAVHGPLTIKPGQEMSGVEMTAERGPRAVVTVLDPDGEPIEKAQVRLSKVTAATTSSPKSMDLGNAMLLPGMGFHLAYKGEVHSRTDKDGKCELGGAEPGQYEITATHSSWVTPEAIAIAMPAKGIVEATVRMLAGGTVALLVLDHKGKPAAGQKYRIMTKEAAVAAKTPAPKNASGSFSFSFYTQMLVGGGFRSGSRGKQGHTDASGRANVGPLAPGDYVAFLELGAGNVTMAMDWGGLSLPRSGDRQLGEQLPFQIVPGQTVEVTLTRPQMAILTGTIRGDAGPVRNASVTLMPGGSGPSAYSDMRQTRTDADGVYRLSGLKSGEYELAVRTSGRSSGIGLAHCLRVEIPGVGEHRQDMFLQQGSVEVRLRKDGKPAEGVKVMLAPVGSRNGGYKVKASNSEGLIKFEHVPTGRYTLRYEDSKYLDPGRQIFEVESGSMARRELPVKPSAILRYDCKPAPGTEEVQGFTIEYIHEGNKPKTRQRHGLKGKLSGLEPGRYTFRARRRAVPNSNWTVLQTIELKGGEPGRLEFILP